MTLARWRSIWLVAALHNFAGVVLFFFGRDILYGHNGLLPPSPSLHYDTWILFVGVFGIAYLLVAHNPESRWAPGIALVGILAKLASVTPQILAFVFDAARTPIVFALPIGTDLIWVGVFSWFLLRRSR